MFRRTNRDITHAEVRTELRDLGWKVKDTAAAKGFVDLVAFHPKMRAVGVFLIEVKAPLKAHRPSSKTASQVAMADEGWPIVQLTDAESARAWHLALVAWFEGRSRSRP